MITFSVPCIDAAFFVEIVEGHSAPSWREFESLSFRNVEGGIDGGH